LVFLEIGFGICLAYQFLDCDHKPGKILAYLIYSAPNTVVLAIAGLLYEKFVELQQYQF